MPHAALTRHLLKMATCLALAIGLTACGGGGSGGGGANPAGGGTDKPATSHRFSGVVSGLGPGAQLKVRLNNSDALTVNANGPYSFEASVPANGAYAVTVTQPVGQTCSVANASGAGVTGDVSNLNIVCANDAFAISAAVSGLTNGAHLTLNNNANDPLVVSANGNVKFAKPVARNGSYVVTVDAQPAGQTCTVSSGSGAGVTHDVTNVGVVCSTHGFAIRGSVSGLAAGQQVTLRNNAADATVVTANGAFSFAAPVAYNGSYAVTVATQPVGQVCTVNGGSGAGVTGDVGNVAVQCSTTTHSIGGTVSGLASGEQVTLNNNGADPATVNANGSFTFNTPVVHGSNYNVTVLTQPAGQTCTVINGTGTHVTGNITSVGVACSASGFAIGGVVSGLAAGQTLTLKNRGADAFVVTGTGNDLPFTFPTPVPNNVPYAVTMSGQACIVAGGAGVATGPVSTVSVRCDARPSYAYVALSGSDQIGQYVIGTDGALTAMTAATVPAGQAPTAIAVDPSRRYAYAANTNSAFVSQYVIAADGSLSPMTSATVPTGAGTGAWSIAVDPTGRYAYAANNGSDTISQYKIGVDGSLSAMAPATVTSGAFPRSIAVDPTGRYVYVANYGGDSVSQYFIRANGELSPMSTASVAVHSAWSVSVDPTGRFAYVTNWAGDTVSQFTIGADGSLGALAPTVATGVGPHAIAIDPTGRYAYVPNANADTVAQYAIDGINGALAAMTPDVVSAGNLPFSLAFDPAGRFAYVVNSNDGTIFQYDVATSNGALTYRRTAAAGNPQAIVTTYAR
ncbi:beta-propeller fold lactonase family protein [Variovorax sp. J22R133]|uniref:beta-propeller fold lactonase family protein n=1 Tax=Variovorax brevis TaxID=3053503 RepID=UPI00257854F3|nr:beta-propeller fold lactonase family protein [Variovorax sp. J22R133]MDM0111460.1 beta-propeller fold lactonase family protein [Variovorax sp. J22R133]